MSKKVYLFINIVILLSSSGVLAGIFQLEGVSIDADNYAQRSGGFGSAFATNGAFVAKGQMAHDSSSGSTAIQGEGAIVGQAAGAIGLGGFSGVCQHVDVDGCQLQCVGRPGNAIYPTNTTAQHQGLEVSAGQTAFNVGSIGGSGGLQGALAGQKQMAVTPNGFGAQSQCVGIGQVAAVAGGPGSIAVVHQSAEVKAHQSQFNY